MKLDWVEQNKDQIWIVWCFFYRFTNGQNYHVNHTISFQSIIENGESEWNEQNNSAPAAPFRTIALYVCMRLK